MIHRADFVFLSVVFLIIGISVYAGAQTSVTPTVWHELQRITKSSTNLVSVDMNNNQIIDHADSAMTVNGQQVCLHGQGCNGGQYSCRLIYTGEGQTAQTLAIQKPDQCGRIAYGNWNAYSGNPNGFSNNPPPNSPVPVGLPSSHYGGCQLVISVHQAGGGPAMDVYNLIYSQVGEPSFIENPTRWSALADHTSSSPGPQRFTGTYPQSAPISNSVGNVIIRVAGTSVADEIAIYDTHSSSAYSGSLSISPDWVDKWVIRDINPSSNVKILVC